MPKDRLTPSSEDGSMTCSAAHDDVKNSPEEHLKVHSACNVGMLGSSSSHFREADDNGVATLLSSIFSHTKVGIHHPRTSLFVKVPNLKGPANTGNGEHSSVIDDWHM